MKNKIVLDLFDFAHNAKWLLLVLLSLHVNSSWALSIDESKHLLLRAGFGAKPVLLEQLKNLDRAQAVAQLLSQKSQFSSPPNCVFAVLPDRKARKASSTAQKKEAQKAQRKCGVELKSWYLTQLIDSDAVLHNQMTLLWHNHFTSSLKKVRFSQLIYRQHQKISEHALGDFSVLLMAMVNDPAMLKYLDNINNTKAKPNENLGRELLELFSLGEGNYTEADIVSASKALTGLSIDTNTYATLLREKRHDKSVKQIFGNRKIRSADDLIKMILAQPQSANYIVKTIWLHFISREDPRQIKRLAKGFAKNWDIKALVAKILNSEQFWRDQGQMFKSPLELVVGSAQLFKGLKIPNKRMLYTMKAMGQDLFDPPNVKGWPKGKNWLDENKLVLRMNTSNALARAIQANMAVMGAPYCQGKMAALSALPLIAEREVSNSMSSSCQKQLAKIVTNPSWQLK